MSSSLKTLRRCYVLTNDSQPQISAFERPSCARRAICPSSEDELFTRLDSALTDLSPFRHQLAATARRPRGCSPQPTATLAR